MSGRYPAGPAVRFAWLDPGEVGPVRLAATVYGIGSDSRVRYEPPRDRSAKARPWMCGQCGRGICGHVLEVVDHLEEAVWLRMTATPPPTGTAPVLFGLVACPPRVESTEVIATVRGCRVTLDAEGWLCNDDAHGAGLGCDHTTSVRNRLAATALRGMAVAR